MALFVQPALVARRLVVAAVGIAVAEAVGLGAYLAVLKPGMVESLSSSGASPTEKALVVLGSPDVLIIAVALAGFALAYAIRSNPTGDTGSDESIATLDSATGSDEAGAGESGFSFGDDSE